MKHLAFRALLLSLPLLGACGLLLPLLELQSLHTAKSLYTITADFVLTPSNDANAPYTMKLANALLDTSSAFNLPLSCPQSAILQHETDANGNTVITETPDIAYDANDASFRLTFRIRTDQEMIASDLHASLAGTSPELSSAKNTTSIDSPNQAVLSPNDIDSSSMNPSTLLMMVEFAMINQIDYEIQMQADELQARNRQIQSNNSRMAELRSQRAALIDPSTGQVAHKTCTTEDGTTKDCDSYYQQQLDNLKTANDTLQNSNQMDMIRLQNYMNARSTTFDMVTNILSKDQKTRDSIIGNLR